MKRLFPLMIICFLILTGCGNKKLTCTLNEKNKGIETDTKVVGKFSGSKLSSLSLEITNNLSDYSGSVSNYINVWKKVYGLYDNLDGVDVLFEENDSSIKTTINLKISEMTDDSKKGFNLIDLNKDFRTLKYDYLALGYTCK